MAGFDDPASYGDRWAGVYDEHHADLDATAAAEFLAGLAGTGCALELAIGTGRVALPLAGHGIAVEGVDASAAMVERLRAKPGGESIPVTIGDMAEVPVSGPFRLVYLVFNTLFGLLSRARQADCFRNVAQALDPDGVFWVFVIECFVPDLARFDRDQRVQTLAVTEDSATIELSRHDSAGQRVTTEIVTLDGQGMHLRPVAIRYSWPSELDTLWPSRQVFDYGNATATGTGGRSAPTAASTSRCTSGPDRPTRLGTSAHSGCRQARQRRGRT